MSIDELIEICRQNDCNFTIEFDHKEWLFKVYIFDANGKTHSATFHGPEDAISDCIDEFLNRETA
jgi:hypothetical protein